jgi:transposase
MKKIILSKKQLIKLYYKDNKSLNEIAEILNISYGCILNNFIRYNLSRRTLSLANHFKKQPNKYNINKNLLKILYINKHLSTLKISKLLKCSYGTILYYINKFKIKTHRLDYPSPFKGKHHTIKNKKILSIKHQGLKYKIPLKTQIRLSKLKSQRFKGKNNPMFGRKGKLSPTWRGGISFKPYSLKWTKKLRTQIRIRDNYTCQKCRIKEKSSNRKLTVHHIDYDKQNCKKDNLISLCCKCNSEVNFNRDYWYAYFTYIMENFIYG